jgi:hypothetical protein
VYQQKTYSDLRTEEMLIDRYHHYFNRGENMGLQRIMNKHKELRKQQRKDLKYEFGISGLRLN